MIRHPKRRGEWVEMQFMARAAAHGLTVSKPWGDSARYDFIVESKGRCLRVQVKSTTWKSGKAYMCNTVSRNITGLVGTYSSASVDFFAFFIVPEDLWYIVPIAELKRAKFAVYLNPYDRKNRYFRYLEAWHLLTRTPKHASKDEANEFWGEVIRDAIQTCVEPPGKPEAASRG
jgi:PD-(D/E)XK endonuclease